MSARRPRPAPRAGSTRVVVARNDPGTSVGGHWRCRTVDAAGALRSLTLVRSARHDDGGSVELTAEDAALHIGDDAVCCCTLDGEDRVTGLSVTAYGAPKAPPLWFVELRESASRPPAVHLLAFSGHGVCAGTLFDDTASVEAGVTSADQLGAARWYPATSEVDQIYVQPQWRRHGIAAALILAASTLAAARDWGWLWGDGHRTELGEHWRLAQPWSERAAPQTHIAPPMTPRE